MNPVAFYSFVVASILQLTLMAIPARVEISPAAALGLLTLALGLVGALVVLSAQLVRHARWLFGGALLMGAGLGALLAGTLVHSILEWHAMSAGRSAADLEITKGFVLGDGLFHLYTWAAALAGGAVVLREVPYVVAVVRARAVGGGALAGWGLFNLVAGSIHSHLLDLRHVFPGNGPLPWEMSLLFGGTLLLVAGFWLALPSLRRPLLGHPAHDLLPDQAARARPTPELVT